MPDTRFHLAQVNIARIAAPLDSAQMSGFMSQLDTLNALADASPGFVWRYQDTHGNATSLRPYPEDDRIILNMSVWETLEALTAYVYHSAHAAPMRRRREWFLPFDGPYQALWWIPAVKRGLTAPPTVEDARQRLAHLRAHGPTPTAFTFRRFFAPDGAETAGPALSADTLLNTPRIPPSQ
jgi:hypothetical protein